MTETMRFRNEAAFTDAVVDLAKLNRWLVHHDRGEMHRHIQGTVGFPDLVLAKAGRILFRELKMPNGKLTLEQESWLHLLRGEVWRPADWRHIVKVLSAP